MSDPHTATTASSARTVFLFACAGHFFIHFCLAFYFVIVLSLEQAWQMPYHDLIGLWTLGALMVGLVAIPAGMVADRYGAPWMIAVFFLGMGGSAITAGFATTPLSIVVSLTGIGIFAAIYHPVAIPWLVRNSRYKKGKALAVNGIFGSFGGAGAAIVSGFLIDTISWQAAFIIPGCIIVAFGVVMLGMIRQRRPLDSVIEAGDHQNNGNAPLVRIFGILMLSMFISGLIYNGTQTALPKVFELRDNGMLGDGVFGLGAVVAIIYIVAGIMQLVGGHLADKYPLKLIYVTAIALQVPFLWLAADADGGALIVIAIFMVVANTAAIPAENILLSRYTPQSRQGLAFGVKFLLSFGAAPLAIQIVAKIQSSTGEFTTLFWFYALLAVVAFVAVAWLPRVENTTAITDAR
jgi:MFS transporter, FSR family, fosmidomycin resistance protein